METIFIPTLLFWENGNTFYGSQGQARFFIQPICLEDSQQVPQLNVELWQGPFTRELSQVIETASFPLTQEGLAQTTRWLEEQAAALNK